MGSRDSQTTTYWTDKEIQVVCGCFKGNLDEFENKVKEVHTGKHLNDYSKYIHIVRSIMEMEKE